MNGLLNPESLEELPAVRGWLSYADATRRIMQENYGHISEPVNRLTAAVEENVLVQVENLRTHPSVAAALSRKQLNVHAWVYKFVTVHSTAGQLFSSEGAGWPMRLAEMDAWRKPKKLRPCLPQVAMAVHIRSW